MTRRPAHLRLLRSSDLITAIRRAGAATLDPLRHAWQHGDHPWMDTRCAWCGCPREDHRSWLGRLLDRLLN